MDEVQKKTEELTEALKLLTQAYDPHFSYGGKTYGNDAYHILEQKKPHSA